MSNTFPTDRIKPRLGKIRGTPGNYSIEIPLAPFEIDDLEFEETAIELEGVSLPSLDWRDLQGKRFEFPVNPEEGFIDASVYIEHAHHPVDVTAITFIEGGEKRLKARLTLRFLFEQEGLEDYEDTDAELTVELKRSSRGRS